MKGSAGLAVYSASKFFIRGLAHAVGLEFGPLGITANVICPTDVYPEGDEPAATWYDDNLVQISCEKEGVRDLDALIVRRIARNPARRSCTARAGQPAIFLCSPRRLHQRLEPSASTARAADLRRVSRSFAAKGTKRFCRPPSSAGRVLTFLPQPPSPRLLFLPPPYHLHLGISVLPERRKRGSSSP
jgi:hypothetical protein